MFLFRKIYIWRMLWRETLGEFRIIDWGFYMTLPVIDGNNTRLNKPNCQRKDR